MNKHIVIIEDDDCLLKLMCGLISGRGYRTTGLNQLSTYEELAELKADCFILDEQLPYVNGHIIGIMLKNKPLTSKIPIILISAFDELESFATMCGANAYLKKPFLHPGVLADMIASVVNQPAGLMIN